MTSSATARDDLIAEVVRRYLSGESIRAVAGGLKRSYGVVQSILKQAGVPARRPGCRPQTAPPDQADAGAAARTPAAAQPDQAGRKPKKAKKKGDAKASEKTKGGENMSKKKSKKKADKKSKKGKKSKKK